MAAPARDASSDSEDEKLLECGACRRFFAQTPAGSAVGARLEYDLPVRGRAPLRVHVSCWAPRAATATATATADPAAICRYVSDATAFVARQPWAHLDARISNLTVRVHLTPLRKRWCAREARIRPCSINSGVTTYDATHRTVDVYRSEDVFKVLLHELLHVFEVDRLVPRNTRRESEAVVEALALLLYLLILVPSSSARARLERERAWMQRQARFLASHPWTSSTSPWSYIVCKTALLSARALPHFLQWLNLASSRGDSAARRAWPAVRDLALSARTDRSAVPDPVGDEAARDAAPDACLSMSLTVHQLALRPRSGGATDPRAGVATDPRR